MRLITQCIVGVFKLFVTFFHDLLEQSVPHIQIYKFKHCVFLFLH